MGVVNLNTIMLAGLLMAFILPAFALVSMTLPPPTVTGNSINLTAEMNASGMYISNQFHHTYGNLSSTLVGSGGCGANAQSGNQVSNCAGTFYTNPTIFQAFAFIVNGLGTIMTDIVQLPYLDYISMQYIVVGFSDILGPSVGFALAGVSLLYVYMGISLLLMGVGMIMKYNPKLG